MIGHLKAAELMDSLEGIPLSPRKTVHLKDCAHCQASLAAISPYFEDLSEPATPDLAVAQLDSDVLRSGVRDQLLARAVKKSSFVPRWTGQALTPTAAWGLGVALLVSMVTLGGLWHYQTSHQTVAVPLTNESGPPAAGLEFAIFMEDSTALETEALAWSDTELFIALNELEASEEEVLLELIALTLEADNGV